MNLLTRTLFAVLCLGVSGTAWSDPPPRWTQAYYYQFESPGKVAGGPVSARIDYVLDDVVLYSTHASFRSDDVRPLTVVLPDPFALAGARGSDEMQVLVFTGETLAASFDLESFRTYNRWLQAVQGGELARVFAGHTLEDGAAAGAAAGPGGITPNTTVGPCADHCREKFQQCLVECSDPLPRPPSGICVQCNRLLNACYASCDNADSDGDGLRDPLDNCPGAYNPDQANCDGDSKGNVCDSVNANYVRSAEQTCMTDKDDHVVTYSFEHHVESVDRDRGPCGAPDVWHRRIRDEATCSFSVDDEDCCRLLTGSLSATGALADDWCRSPNGFRNQDRCHR